MTPAEATAALTYANQLDPLVPLNKASADLWAHALATVTSEHARWVIRDYYQRQGADGQGRAPANPAVIRNHARAGSERAGAKRAALGRGPDVSCRRRVTGWRSRTPGEWDRVVRAGAHEQWDAWQARGETDRNCRCGCGQTPA